MGKEILIDRDGALGIVTLNRPDALNALTLGMVEQLDLVLCDWARDQSVRLVVFRGAGERAFCAGGDVRALWDAGMALRAGTGDGSLLSRFFIAEYRLNRRIHRYAKPIIGLLDGVTMGGGVGLSIHASHPVGTERLNWAMPETGIGLFPDVGGNYFLNHMPGAIGALFGITGHRIGCMDALHVGAIKALVTSKAIDDLLEDLRLLPAVDPSRAHAAVDAVIARYAQRAEPGALTAHRQLIDSAFACNQVEEIIGVLTNADTDFARGILAALNDRSPLSLKLTLAGLHRGRGLAIEDVLRMEYRMVQKCLAGHEFYEGIRAALVDKDRMPRWSPASLAEVDAGSIEQHFCPPPTGDLTFLD